MLNKLRYIFNREEKWKLIGIFILTLIGSVVELLGVSVFLPFIEVMMDPGSISENKLLNFFYTNLGFHSEDHFLIAIAAVICIVYLTKNIYLTFMQNSILKFSFDTRMKLSVRLLTTYMAEPYTFHLNKNISELQRSMQYDCGQFMTLINSSLQLLTECAVILCLGVYLFHTSPTITIVIMTLLAICVGIFFLLSKKVSRKLGKQNEWYNAKLLQWINQSLGGIKEIKVLNREKYFVAQYKDTYAKLNKGAKNNELIAAVPKYIIETVCIIGMVIAIIGKLLFGRRDLTAFVVQMSAFAVASFRLLPSVGKINAYVNSVMYTAPALDIIYEDLKSVEDCSQNIKERDVKEEKWHLEQEIVLSNISYTYEGSEKPVIQNLALTIQKGETVALIGSSGAGKTTLADIILGLLTPQEGSITLDGKDICQNSDAWHRMIGYIPQTIYLSDDSIRNNVAFGIAEEDIDDEAVMAALKKAQLYEFVQTLDEGLDTYVGDRGVRISGGQRQRIGIARALYCDPEILVLDEATSALDNETEEAVMEAIEKLRGTKTMIIIAHRLTTIRNADVIYEVGDGIAIRKEKNEIF